jgi:uncharacterized protein
MTVFNISALNPVTQEQKTIIYDSTHSTLQWEDGTPIINTQINTSQQNQVKIQKSKKPKRVKIQLGLSCNFECDYCNQRFVPHAEESTNSSDVEPFVINMKTWFDGGDDGLGLNRAFEFWGGEPFVYWKTFKPLAEKIHEQYPNAQKSVITNGSLLDKEKVDWLYQYGFNVSVSHDGPGQFVRGPDPLENTLSKEGIMYAFELLAPESRMSFNSMINNKNISRANIESYFVDLIKTTLGEDYLKFLVIGEGTFIDAYDEGGLSASLNDEEEELKFRNISYNELRDGSVKRFASINQKVKSFINSIQLGTRKESLTQKCGMDLQENIAIDLNGNVLTCQNVSTSSLNPSGISHHIGHVSDLANVEVKTGTHWSDRDECSKCPVLHICQGACFFLTGPLWEASCNNAYSDNIVMFATAIEAITGLVPMYIDGPLRQDRKDIFWWVNGKPENTRKAKKVIPITAI